MKLINKKTGKILEDVKLIDTSLTTIEINYLDDGVLRIETEKDYHSFLQNWKDYDPPKEPLIEDEKIRKCVKLWAELNGYGKSLMYSEGNNWSDNWCSFYEPIDEEELLFRKLKCTNLQNKKVYTIAELCGEDEE